MNENPTAEQKVAIVTGGASGLGYAIVEKFVQSGIRTVVIGRNEEKLNAAREAFGDLCSTISFDLSNLQGIPELVESIAREQGRIDILVNNAGINMKKPFTEVSDDDFQKIILTNVNAVFALSREVVKVMLGQKQGSIVNISSMASQYGIPKVIAYTASKSAIEGMTRAMAVDLSPEGIRVNCVAPGFIESPMTEALNDPIGLMFGIALLKMAELPGPQLEPKK